MKHSTIIVDAGRRKEGGQMNPQRDKASFLFEIRDDGYRLHVKCSPTSG